MAFRELQVIEIREVLRLWAAGRGYRTIAARSGMDRKTVRRYVEAGRLFGLARDGTGREIDDEMISRVAVTVRPGTASVPGAMREHCRAHADRIRRWVEQDRAGGPKVQRLLARHTGVAVPLRTLQRFIAEELGRGGRGRTVRLAPPPSPGRELEIDFMQAGEFTERGSDRRRMMYALICTAVSSRHQFVWPCTSQTRRDVIEGLEAAWRFFGGVFGVVICDNLKPVIDKPDPVKPKVNPEFMEYAQARGFEIDACRRGRPRDKGTVERQVQYVRGDWFAGERFGSVQEAREAAEHWCLEIAGMRTHGTTGRRPVEVFEQYEKPSLLPEPTEPYDRPRWTDMTLGRDGALPVEHSLYSVPYTVPEGPVRVRYDRATVKIYRRNRLLKVHTRVAAGEHSIDSGDLPPGRAALVTRSGEDLLRTAAGFGAHVAEYTRRLLEGPLPWTRIRHVFRLHALVKRYGADAVDEACARALELDVVDVTRIRRMLEQGLRRRGLLRVPAPRPPSRPDNVIPLRFARQADEYRTGRRPPPGEPDATA